MKDNVILDNVKGNRMSMIGAILDKYWLNKSNK